MLSIADRSSAAPVPAVTNHGLFLAPLGYDCGHRSTGRSYDHRHWRAGKLVLYTGENKRIFHQEDIS